MNRAFESMTCIYWHTLASIKTEKLQRTEFFVHLLPSQGSAMAKQLGAEAYLECSAFTSEKSIHSVFRTAALACINKLQPLAKPSPTRRLSKRLLHLPSKSELISSTFKKEKAKSCSVMWVENFTPHNKSYTIPCALVWGRGVGSDCHIIDMWNPSSPPKETPFRTSGHLAVLLVLSSSTVHMYFHYCILLFQMRFDHQPSSIHSLLSRDLLSLCQLKLGMIQLSK